MTTKRYDNKNRILRVGEYQRSDGRYEYKYIDADGKRKSIYSWRLTRSDKLPAGKPDCDCLRDMEAIIKKQLSDGINSTSKTLNDFYLDFDKSNKYRIADATRSTYRRYYDNYVKCSLGKRKIATITQSDILSLYFGLLENGTLAKSSIKIINNVLRQVFEMAVEDKCITNNPCDNVMKKLGYEKPDQRCAITKEQWNLLVEFMQKSKKYVYWIPIMTIFSQTGLRASELCGLTWDDIDFENNLISVNHSLRYTQDENDKYYYHVEPPKSKAGFRSIPMTTQVRKFLLEIKRQQDSQRTNDIVVDGIKGFVFLNQRGHLYNSNLLSCALYRIVRDFNYEEMETAITECREPVLIPKISCHNLRHTFVTWLVESDVNIKSVQSIAGHADIGTTIDVYASASKKKNKKTMELLDSSLGLS